MKLGQKVAIAGAVFGLGAAVLLRTSAIAASIQANLQSTQAVLGVTYCSPNGVNLLMDLYLPIQTTAVVVPTPVVLDIPGGGWVSGGRSNQWALDLFPQLNAQGIALASIDYRLAPGYKFPNQIQDVACAVRFLRANAAQFNLNPARIGAFGESAGGHLALLLGLTSGAASLWGTDSDWLGYPSNVNAVVDWFGPADLTQSTDFAWQVKAAISQTFGILPWKLRAASPVAYVNYQSPPPILIEHGINDSLVNVHQSVELNGFLSGTRQLIQVANADHSWHQVGTSPISPPLWQIEQNAVNWFQTYL